MKPDFCIGIDPGKNTGVAVWDRRSQEFTEIKTLDFWRLHSELNDICFRGEQSNYLIVIEDPRKNPAVWFEDKRAKKEEFRKAMHAAQAVGMNKREAGLLIEFIKRAGFQYWTQKPQGKLKSEEFKSLTKWPKRCSQDARDAAMLVFGMK